jgi:hypothetical protein
VSTSERWFMPLTTFDIELQEALASPPRLWLYFSYCLPSTVSCQSFSFLFFSDSRFGRGFTMSSKSTGMFQTPGALYREFLKAVIFDENSAICLVGEAAFQMG